MLNAIIRFSVRNKLIIGLLTAALIIWGLIDLRKLPIDALPDITSNQVQLITVSPSLAAPEVERLITFPLEQATATIPGVQQMRSISRFGLSVITIVFSDETDIYWARQQVGEKLTIAREEIPAGVGIPELAPPTTGLGEIFQYVLRPEKGYEGMYNLAELRSVQDWIVRRQLLGTDGVADVSSFGGYLKQYEVAVNPGQLKSTGTTIAEIFTALQKNNQNSGGAYIERGPNALFIRTEGMAESLEEIGNIVVKHTDRGVPVFIRDVAEVQTGHAIRYGALTYRDHGEVSGAVVLMLKGANASRVIENVKAKIEQIKKTLPEGIILEPYYDRTKMVNRAINTVQTNLLEGALIVVFVLVIFLGNFRAGLIVASVIPLSMLFAVIMMNLFNVSGNLMSLGALDFGLIVDGAVIIVEAVLHRLHAPSTLSNQSIITRQMMNDEVERSAGKMMNSAVFGQIIILIVYVPILSLTGIEGKMFRPMAQTVSFALIGAFLLSFTYVPMVSSLLLSRKIDRRATFSDRMMTKIYSLYRPVLRRALAFPKITVAIAVSLFVLSLLLLSRLGGEFIPEMEEGDFAVDARLMTGSSLSETISTTQKAAAILQQQFPEVEKIVTRIGASEIPTDPMPLEMTDIMISLKPKKEWTSAGSFDELANKMSESLEALPGMTSGFQFPVQMRFNELISGARQDVVCKIFGEDLDSLSSFAQRLSGIIATVGGATDIYLETVTGLPQIVVKYHREAIANYRLTIEDINQVIRTAFAGESAGLIYENERRYDLVVRLKEDVRTDINDVQHLLVPTPMGQQVPLRQLADITIKAGPNQIQREDARRRIIVGFNVRGRDVESVVEELETKAARQLTLPAGYFIKYGGQFENLIEAKERLSIAVPVALLLIMILLYFAFGSIKYGLLVFSAIPLSAIGGVLALWIRGMPFSISAGVGFIALFGVSVLNGIVLIAEFIRLKKQNINDVNEIIMQGTKIRLRPVLMTASVASLGFLPMAFSQGAGAEVQRPLATVVIGGLITATLLTLIILPILYAWIQTRNGSGTKKVSLACVTALLLIPAMADAQRTLPLEDMLRQADSQHVYLQAVKKEGEYWKQLRRGVFDPPKTQMGGEYGGISSAFNDTRFFVSQGVGLPAVYNRRRDLYASQEEALQRLGSWRRAEVEREVKLVFYRIADRLERIRILDRLDSVYKDFQRVAALRYESGETNLLEKTTADAQIQRIRLQKQEALADIRIDQHQLKWLMNSEEDYLPLYQTLKKKTALAGDTSIIAQHPQIAYSRQLQEVAISQTRAERTALLPELEVGYSNQSLIGYQSADGIAQKYYGAGDRFHVVNLTLGVPLFNRAMKARVRAGTANEQAARLNTEALTGQLQMRHQQLLDEFRKQTKNLDYYEKTGQQQAELIIRNARLTFENGEIGYLEWTILMNNAVTIQLDYLEAVHLYNASVIELEYLTTK